MKRKSILISILILGGLALVSGLAWRFYEDRTDSGAVAPDFALPYLTQNGKRVEGTFRLSEQRGRVVLINFWGSWCTPCRDEAPLLQHTYEAFRDEDVVFVGVAIDDEIPGALAYIAEFGITYTTVIDIRDEMEDIYHIYGVPITLIVDKKGIVRKTYFSQPDELDLYQAIEDSL